MTTLTPGVLSPEVSPESSALPGTSWLRDITDPPPLSLASWTQHPYPGSFPDALTARLLPCEYSQSLNTVRLQVYLLLPFNQACKFLKYKASHFRFFKKRNWPILLIIVVCLLTQTVKKKKNYETTTFEQWLDIWWISGGIKELLLIFLGMIIVL